MAEYQRNQAADQTSEDQTIRNDTHRFPDQTSGRMLPSELRKPRSNRAKSKEHKRLNTHKLVLQYIVPCMNSYGLCIVDNFLGDRIGERVVQEVKRIHQSGNMQDGQLVSQKLNKSKAIRGDKIAWVDGTESGCQNISYLLTRMDKLITCADGKLDKFKIRGRHKHAMDSQLESLALEQVVPALLDQGFFYVDHFLGDIAGHMVLGQVKRMHYCGLLNDGQLARRSNGVCRRSIRGDKITWVNGTERGTEAVNFLLTLIDKLISLCVGQLGKSIRARSKAMVACYPGNGAGYVKHVDNPNADGRCVTCIYYLNKNWNAKEHGGMLRIFPEGKSYVADIEPLFDRLLLFWSDRRNPHEVQPSYATRYAITVWYFDSEERAEAKRKFRDLTANTQEGSSS
uniref:hypoxia-inducible factor-proline dioxygenase n=1 Tax=Cyprinus carpio carpio TaxID=630221 RepID=A0A8C1HEI1_CYPCA